MARLSGETAEQALETALKGATAVPASAPTVADLRRHLGRVRHAHHLFDCVNLAQGKGGPDRPAEMHLLYDRAEAIRDMIATQPAQSLSDAAVAIAESMMVAASMSADGDVPDGAVEAFDRIERMLLPALPFVTAAAGVDTEAMYWGDCATAWGTA